MVLLQTISFVISCLTLHQIGAASASQNLFCLSPPYACNIIQLGSIRTVAVSIICGPVWTKKQHRDLWAGAQNRRPPPTPITTASRSIFDGLSQPVTGFILTTIDCGVHSTLRSNVASPQRKRRGAALSRRRVVGRSTAV